MSRSWAAWRWRTIDAVVHICFVLAIGLVLGLEKLMQLVNECKARHWMDVVELAGELKARGLAKAVELINALRARGVIHE